MTDIQLGDPDTRKAQIRSERGGCADCSLYEKCRLDLPRYGSTKGHGPHYVAYTLITDAVENSNGKEDFCSCQMFVETMWDRMISGQMADAEGRKGAEIVRLLVGRKTVVQGMEMGFNGKGEIIKPQPNQIEDLKRAGYTVNLADTSPAVEWRLVEFERTIPPYKRPGKTTGTYSEKMRARETEARAREMEAEDRRFEERDAERRRPGRPRGSKNHRPEDELEPDDFEKDSNA